MDDPVGNAVCLGVAGAERGRVWFWDHEDERMRFLADSFTDFVAGVRAVDDDES